MEDKQKSAEEQLMAEQRAWRAQERRRQILGILIGLGVGIGLLYTVPFFSQSFGSVETLLWSAAIGGIFGSLGSFEKAGAALTRRDNRMLNLGISLGFVIIVLAVLLWLL